MLQAVAKSESVVRLKELLRNRYNKVLKIDWIKSVSSLDTCDGNHHIKNGTLHIPIQVHQHFFAMAMVEEINQLSNEDHLLITELVKLILEPEFYNWYLRQLSHNAKARAQAENVISIFSDSASSVFANVIFFQTRNPHLIPRLANEAHEISQRWACLKYKDIQSQVKTAEDIKALGSLTLVIDDVLELSPSQQAIIYQYFQDVLTSQHPLLIIGSASEIESLENQNLIEPNLAQILKFHRLEADRLPSDPKLLHDALEIMLES